jgi:hypothetical protein
VILIGINPTIVIALDMTNNEPGNNTDFGGLSAESTDIAEADKTDLINGTNNNNGTDFAFLFLPDFAFLFLANLLHLSLTEYLTNCILFKFFL